jgi:hypothetical protein
MSLLIHAAPLAVPASATTYYVRKRGDDVLQAAARPSSTGWDLGCYESSVAGASGGWQVLQCVEIDKPGP